jgi:hypothetical protein
MSESSMTAAEARRARLLCYVAAAVFAGCGTLFLFISASPPVRGVGAGFNFIVALAVVLYARTLRANP